jgi:hypothetical protein
VQQIREAILAQITQADPRREGLAHQITGGLGEQRLPAVGDRPQPRAAVDRAAVVVTLAQIGFPGVQCGAHRQGDPLGPRLGVQSLLEGSRGGHGITGPGEYGKTAVALAEGPHHHPAVPLHRPLDQGVVAGHGRPHRRGVLPPEAGAALHVGEEKGDRPGGQRAQGSLPARAVAVAATLQRVLAVIIRPRRGACHWP